MSKFYGAVGFGLSEQKQTSPGVWEVVPSEKNFYGDILENNYRNQDTDRLNDDKKITNRISIVADQYAHDHMFDIIYVIWKGIKWEVLSVNEQFPRLILSLGGRYVS